MKLKISTFLWILVFLPTLFAAQANKWRMKTYNEPFKNKFSAPKEKRSVLVLKNEIGGEKIYKPEKPPFGMGKKQILEINGHTLAMTLWPDGAYMMVIRVFDPQVSEKPLCEVVSFAEGLKVRLVDNVVEVEKALDQKRTKKFVKQWEKCYTYK